MEENGRIDSESKSFLLYVQTSDDPERQYSPIILAQTAIAMKIRAKVYYLGQALRVLLPEKAKEIKIGEFPSLYELIKEAMSQGVEFYVCSASKRMLGWDMVDLIEGLNIVGAGTLNDLVLDAGGTMWF